MRGRKPGMKSFHQNQTKERWNWRGVPTRYTQEQKDQLLKDGIRLMIKTTFSTHIYK